MATSALVIPEKELRDLFKRLDKVVEPFQDRKTRIRLLRPGAREVAREAELRTPTSNRPHFTYNTPKISKRRRAPKGQGVKKNKYVPGNLAKSIKALVFRRSSDLYIGPKFNRRGARQGGQVFGQTRGKTDPFYAQMLYGSALAFQRRILIPALQSAAPRAFRKVEDAVRKEIEKQAKKNGLD